MKERFLLVAIWLDWVLSNMPFIRDVFAVISLAAASLASIAYALYYFKKSKSIDDGKETI